MLACRLNAALNIRVKYWLKWALAAFVLLFLLLAGGLLLHPYWLPGLANLKLDRLLKERDIETAELAFSKLDLSGMEMDIHTLTADGLTLSNTDILVDYSLDSLRRKEVVGIEIDHPTLTVDLPKLLKKRTESEQTEPPAEPRTPALPLALPFQWLSVNNGTIELLSSESTQSFIGQLSLNRGSPNRMIASLSANQDRIHISGTFNLADHSSETLFEADTSNPTRWTDLATELGFNILPENIGFTLGSAKLEGALRTNQNQLQDWTIIGTTSGVEISSPHVELNAGLINMGASGLKVNPQKVWAGLLDATFSNEKVSFTTEDVSFETVGPERLRARLSPWQLQVTLPGGTQGHGLIGISGGFGYLTVNGSWAESIANTSADALGAELRMPKHPLQIGVSPYSLNGNLELNATLHPGPKRQIELTGQLSEANISSDKADATFDNIALQSSGPLSAGQTVTLSLENGRVEWAEGAGVLSNLHGTLEVQSVLPFKLEGPQSLQFDSIAQGELVANNGLIRFNYDEDATDGARTASVTVVAQTLGGSLSAESKLTMREVWEWDARLGLTQIELTRLAALLPDFDGSISGRVNGNLPIRMIGNRIILQPGYLEMPPGETGHFSYTRKGWLTQDASLDTEAYVAKRDLAKLMQEPNGAAIITELAMRNLRMTAFRLDVLKPGMGDRRVIIRIEGDSTIKGITVPVVQDIRVGGDVKETLNLILKVQDRIEF